MNTLFNQLGFLSLLTAVLVGFSACGSDDVAHTSILVLQKQPVSTGLQPIPVEGASVRLYVNKPSNFVEVRLITDNTGHVSFEYDFPVLLDIEVEHNGRMANKGAEMILGETTNARVILPE